MPTYLQKPVTLVPLLPFCVFLFVPYKFFYIGGEIQCQRQVSISLEEDKQKVLAFVLKFYGFTAQKCISLGMCFSNKTLKLISAAVAA